MRNRLAFFSAFLLSSGAQAGGMVLPVHGVRSLARAGALVAGADDADALWLDPAGLAHVEKRQRALLFDVAYIYQRVEHTRLDATGAPLDPVENQQPGQAIPQLAGALAVADGLVIAGGIATPYSGVHRYADTTPQRYASVSLADSRFVIVSIGAAYAVDDRLRVGLALQNIVSQLRSRVIASGCPPTATCAAEDRGFDAAIQIEQDDFVSPSALAGLQYDATPQLTVGLAVQAPTRVSATGTFTLELPSALDGATVQGDRGRIEFTLPPAVRAGVEWRPGGGAMRVEAALAAELWSFHDAIELEPIDITVENAPGGPLAARRMVIPRDYGTSLSPSVAVEWHGPKLMVGAGYAYESAAAPAGDVSVLTVDANKHVLGIGGGYEDEGWQIGAAVGLSVLADVDVAPADARVPQLSVFRPATPAAVNAGSYKSSYVLAGLRFARRW